MTGLSPQAPSGAPTASASRFVATFAAIVAAIAVLLAADTLLARIDRSESASHAASLYRDGTTMLSHGDARGATDKFAAAVAAERTNTTYALGLAEAMLRDNRLQDAETTLQELLSRAEMDGAVNIAMAHVLEREGRYDEAKAFYHRAIYGRWREDTAAARLRARFELIDLLARRRDNPELVAELLPFQESPPDSIALRRKVAHLFVVAGSPARGAAMFRDLLRRSSRDGDAYAGLGEAALALGSFHAARNDLSIAARLRPTDARIADELQVADTALSLDPLEPGLAIVDRERRARRVLELTLSDLSSCGGWPPASARAAQDSAQHLLASRKDHRARETMIDAMGSVAGDLWKSRPPACAAGTTPADRALHFILKKMSQ